MPDRLLERYEEAERDHDLVSMRGELAMVTARIQELLEQVDQGEAGRLWLELRELTSEYRKTPDALEKAVLLADIFQNIQQGAADYMSWQEAIALTETRRKLAETEQKRMVALRQYITAEQATHMIATLSDIVTRNVHDPAVLARIRNELAGTLASGNVGPTNAALPVSSTVR